VYLVWSLFLIVYARAISLAADLLRTILILSTSATSNSFGGNIFLFFGNKLVEVAIAQKLF